MLSSTDMTFKGISEPKNSQFTYCVDFCISFTHSLNKTNKKFKRMYVRNSERAPFELNMGKLFALLLSGKESNLPRRHIQVNFESLFLN